MSGSEFFEESGNGKPASQAYWNALSKLRSAWREVFDEDLEAHGSRAMDSFENALENLKARLRGDPENRKKFLACLDVEPGEDIANVLLRWADIDDLTPNQVKSALLGEFQKAGAGYIDLRPILRTTLDALFDSAQTRRPRVGCNRHWPRLLQYLRELEEETDWSPDGRGVRIVNISRRGPVARDPRDPGRLGLIIDPDYL